MDDEGSSEQFLEVLDLIIKWAFVRAFTSSNTAFLKELLLFIEDLCSFCIEANYQLMEGEGNILLMMLVEKTGVNNAILKDKVIEILRMIGSSSELFPLSGTTLRMFKGLQSKNAKTRAEVLPVIGFLATEHGLQNISEKQMKMIAKLIDSSDSKIRDNALNCCADFAKISPDFFPIIEKTLTVKTTDMLKSRFK